MTLPPSHQPDPGTIDAIIRWADEHLWAPISGALVAMGSALWGAQRKAIHERATVEYVDGHVNGLGARVARNEVDLERRREDVKELHAKIDKVEDSLEHKVDKLHERLDDGLRDIFNELRRIKP